MAVSDISAFSIQPSRAISADGKADACARARSIAASLAAVWPRIAATIQRLALSKEELLEAATKNGSPASPKKPQSIRDEER